MSPVIPEKTDLPTKQLAYSPEIISEYPLIINASPVGTFPQTEESPDIPYHYITTNHLLYDLVYNPKKRCSLKRGKRKVPQPKTAKKCWKFKLVQPGKSGTPDFRTLLVFLDKTRQKTKTSKYAPEQRVVKISPPYISHVRGRWKLLSFS